MKSYLVIGMGRFGVSVASNLYELGNEVIAIDDHPDKITDIAESVTHAVAGDARDEAVLKAVGARNVDCAIVAIGEVAASVLITLALKELGVKTVICKARSESHKKILEKIGADRAVFPEYELGKKLAQTLSSQHVLEFVEFAKNFAVAELIAPAPWVGHSLKQLDIRVKFGVNVIGSRKRNLENVTMSPSADYIIEKDDILFVVGDDDSINLVQAL